MIETSRTERDTYERREASPNISAIFEQLRNDVSAILSGTFALLRKELSENSERTRKLAWQVSVHMLVASIGAFFLIAGINLLAIDLLSPEILSAKTAAWTCVLSTGVILSVVGFVFTKRSAKKLRMESIIPDRTLESLEQSFKWATNKAEEVLRK